MLSDEQLKKLGLSRMGERATLVEACRRACLVAALAIVLLITIYIAS